MTDPLEGKSKEKTSKFFLKAHLTIALLKLEMDPDGPALEDLSLLDFEGCEDFQQELEEKIAEATRTRPEREAALRRTLEDLSPQFVAAVAAEKAARPKTPAETIAGELAAKFRWELAAALTKQALRDRLGIKVRVVGRHGRTLELSGAHMTKEKACRLVEGEGGILSRVGPAGFTRVVCSDNRASSWTWEA